MRLWQDVGGGRAQGAARGWEAQIRAAHAGDERAVRALLSEVGDAVELMVDAVAGREHPERSELVEESLLDFLWALGATSVDRRLEHVASFVALARALEARRSGPPAPVAANDPWAGFAAALDRLTDPQAEALALRLVAGLSIQEIGEVTGIPAPVVRSSLRQAKDALHNGGGGGGTGTSVRGGGGARAGAAGTGVA